MNPKIAKITDDIAKLRRKITDSQARLRELERQKVELENAGIIAAVRAVDVPPEELGAILAQLKMENGELRMKSNVGSSGSRTTNSALDKEDLPFEDED